MGTQKDKYKDGKGYTKNNQEGASGYNKSGTRAESELKSKTSTPYNSNKRMGGDNANYKTKNNPVDAEMDKLQDEEDEKRGITQTLKNVWDAYTD